jgi:hypothetical protein
MRDSSPRGRGDVNVGGTDGAGSWGRRGKHARLFGRFAGRRQGKKRGRALAHGSLLAVNGKTALFSTRSTERRGRRGAIQVALRVGKGRSKNRGHLLRQEGSAAKTEAMLTQTRAPQQKPGSGIRGRRERSKNGGQECAIEASAARTEAMFTQTKCAQQEPRHCLRNQGSRSKNWSPVDLSKGRVAAPEPLFGREKPRRCPGATLSGQESRVGATDPPFRVGKAASQRWSLFFAFGKARLRREVRRCLLKIGTCAQSTRCPSR